MEAVASIVKRRLAPTLVFSAVAEARAVVEKEKLIVATHDGSFHCDEAMACGILHFTERFAQPAIVRTRVPDDINQCDAVVDVGATYDPVNNRLDHHQGEFQGTMTTTREQYKTRLSSAGLVYKHYGLEIIRTFADELVAAGVIAAAPSAAHVELVFDVVYKQFVEHVDGIDNGVEQFSAAAEPAGARVVKNYHVPSTLSGRVAALHTRWYEKQSKQRDNEQFAKAMQLCAEEFFYSVEYTLSSWLPARSLVEEAFNARLQEHPSGSIVVMRGASVPWKDHLLDLEKEQNQQGKVLYMVFQDDRGGGRVQCVPEADSSFKNRKSLPWRGLRDEDLTKASGIPGGVFVHVSGFIGGNKTFEGAIAMAVKAVELPVE